MKTARDTKNPRQDRVKIPGKMGFSELAMYNQVAWICLGVLLIIIVGCSSSSKNMPSLTFGNGVNKDRLFGAQMDEGRLRLTAPIMSIAVPWPSFQGSSGGTVAAGMLMLMDSEGKPVSYDDNASTWSTDPAFALYFHEGQTNFPAEKRVPYTGAVELIRTNNSVATKIMLSYIKDGRLHGTTHVWHETGEPKLELTYDQGDIVARKAWESNGILIAQFPSDSSGTDDNKTTVVPKPDPNLPDLTKLQLKGNQMFMPDAIDSFTGTAGKTYPNGKLERQESFVDGLRDGNATWWHPNNNVWFKATYVAGSPEGRVEAWREDGTREYVHEFQSELPTRMITYKPDGTESGRVDDNNPDGTLTYYHENGKKKYEQIYSGGFFGTMNEKWYDKEGKPITPEPDGGEQNPPPVPVPGQP